MKKILVKSEIDHMARVDLYARKVNQIFLNASKEAVQLGLSLSSVDSKRPFAFTDYPQSKARLDKLLKSLHSSLTTTITDATYDEWIEACKKNDQLVGVFANNVSLSAAQLAKYQSRNLEALSAFQQRKTKGLNLSDKVWRYTNQFKGDIEMALDVGIADGRSAAELSKDVRAYLQEPQKLFRRVRNKNGNLIPSREMKKYLSERQTGGYASSYKNAMRLTRTEINMAYRASDYESNQQLDFVVGIEIKRSNHVFACPICESLKGKYPKDFKFTGWHPQCRCYTISILATIDEFARMQNGEKFTPKDSVLKLPEEFSKWVKDNADTIAQAKSKGRLPYFLSDNARILK